MGFIDREGRVGRGFLSFNRNVLLIEGGLIVATGALGLAGFGLAAAAHGPLVAAFALDAAGSPAAENVVLKK
jgi:hypothetical protein